MAEGHAKGVALAHPPPSLLGAGGFPRPKGDRPKAVGEPDGFRENPAAPKGPSQRASPTDAKHLALGRSPMGLRSKPWGVV